MSEVWETDDEALDQVWVNIDSCLDLATQESPLIERLRQARRQGYWRALVGPVRQGDSLAVMEIFELE